MKLDEDEKTSDASAKMQKSNSAVTTNSSKKTLDNSEAMIDSQSKQISAAMVANEGEINMDRRYTKKKQRGGAA